jgi:hypothetical protein
MDLKILVAGALLLPCLLVPCLAAATAKVHTVALGAVRHVPYSAATDANGALPSEKELRVRPLVIDGKARDWTTGELHAVTDRSFAPGSSSTERMVATSHSSCRSTIRPSPRSSGIGTTPPTADSRPAVNSYMLSWRNSARASRCSRKNSAPGRRMRPRPRRQRKSERLPVARPPGSANPSASPFSTPATLVGLSAVLVEDGDGDESTGDAAARSGSENGAGPSKPR